VRFAHLLLRVGVFWLSCRWSLSSQCVLTQTGSRAQTRSLSQVDHHTVKMHTAFIRNRGDGDFTEWRKAWALADSDNDDLIPVQEAPRIFKVQLLLL